MRQKGGIGLIGKRLNERPGITASAKHWIGVTAASLILCGAPSFALGSPDVLPLEQMAYVIPARRDLCKAWKDRYMSMLSPGGKAYFLANRGDYSQALAELEKLSGPDNGSRHYLRGFCLVGQGKASLAVKEYELARNKIGMVFDPGAKFYFHFADAQMKASLLDSSKKTLEIARLKSVRAERYLRRPKVFVETAIRRISSILEKQGCYRQAFEGYASLFPATTLDAVLNNPLQKSRLSNRGRISGKDSPPADRVLRIRYYLARGRERLTAGDTASAIENFQRAISVEPLIANRVGAETARMESGMDAGRYKDEAKLELLRIYYGRKDFVQSCRTIRSLFLIDPMKDSENWLCSVSMIDVPELVRQSDSDLHATNVEHLLDERLLEAYGPSRFDYRGVDPLENDKLWRLARSNAEKQQFSSCFEKLSAFIDVNERFCLSADFDRQPQRTAIFLQDRDYLARMLRLAVGYACGKFTLEPGFHCDLPLFKHADWDAVEDRLLAVRRRKNTKNDRSYSKSDFTGHCHFAIATRALYERNYKLASSEFCLAASSSKPGSDVCVYSRALANFLAGRRY